MSQIRARDHESIVARSEGGDFRTVASGSAGPVADHGYPGQAGVVLVRVEGQWRQDGRPDGRGTSDSVAHSAAFAGFWS